MGGESLNMRESLSAEGDSLSIRRVFQLITSILIGGESISMRREYQFNTKYSLDSQALVGDVKFLLIDLRDAKMSVNC